MVRGLELFRDHFKNFTANYVLIGGTACAEAFERAGLEFRGTKDLDIVLCVESLDAKFIVHFWNFIKAGNYAIQQKSSGKKIFYRFTKPDREDFPFMLELFSGKPETFVLPDESRIIPIPADEDISSLSAILLDENYYRFIQASKVIRDDLTLIPAESLIVLKSKAWLDLSLRKEKGEAGDSQNIKKHINDIFRLYRVVSFTSPVPVASSIKNELREIFGRMQNEKINLKALGITGKTSREIIDELTRLYEL
jgi:hypothetical protein